MLSVIELDFEIEGIKEYIKLAKDVGAVGIRVFGNALPIEVPEEKTKQQIGKALAEVGEFGYNNGNPDPVRFLKYYRALFLAYQDAI
jgi:hypothetical protein